MGVRPLSCFPLLDPSPSHRANVYVYAYVYDSNFPHTEGCRIFQHFDDIASAVLFVFARMFRFSLIKSIFEVYLQVIA